MLAELAEADARGDIAQIYAEVRDLCAVPYVASLHRHLATRPGWLQWCWAAVRPVYSDGSAQSAAWAAAAGVEVAPLAPLTASALHLLGVDDDARKRIRDVCNSFVRISPTNLMLVGLVRRQLVRRAGHTPADRPGSAWQPPPALGELPPMVNLANASEALRATLLQLSNRVAGQPFVPGLYRMLGHWPAYLAHVATQLGPRLDDPATRDACDAVVAAVDAAAAKVFTRLPPPPESVARPPACEHAAVLEVMERYRETSPQMVVFGSLLANALPAN